MASSIQKTGIERKILKNLIGTTSILALLAACGKQSHEATSGALGVNQGSVVGGRAIPESDTEFKSVVGLTRGTRLFCSGNVIEAKKVITAAHCVMNFDIETEAELEDMLVKSFEVIDNETDGQKNNKAFESADFFGKRAILKAAIRQVVDRDAKKIKLYVGSSKAGGQEAGLDVVESISIPEAAYRHMEAQVLRHTTLKIGEDSTNAYSQKFDYATLKLKSELPGVKPIPLISADEHRDNVLIGGDIRVVGFGLKVDQRFLQASISMVHELEEKIKLESDEAKKAQLQKDLDKEKVMAQTFANLYFTSGNKNYVDLKLENYDANQITLMRKGQTLSGACNGDSGGPSLVRLRKSGEWRQVGVTVTVDVCGNKTQVSPQFRP